MSETTGRQRLQDALSRERKAWRPLWPEVEPVLAARQAKRTLPKPNREGWIGAIRSPLRDDEEPSFSVKPDTEHDPGAWKDHATGESGSMADLARRLGVEMPSKNNGGSRPAPSGPTTLEAFAGARRLDSVQLRATWGVRKGHRNGRCGLIYPTTTGVDRIKYLDGAKPKYQWLKTGGTAHWYGLERAAELASRAPDAEQRSVVMPNGEVSVWACSQEGVPAVCLCAGEGTPPTPELVAELKAAGFDTVKVVYDLDNTGRRGAIGVVGKLRAAGLNAVALELPADLGEGGDVDYLHRRVGEKLNEALAALPELQSDEGDEPANDAADSGLVNGAHQDSSSKSGDSQSTQLVQLAEELYDFGQSEAGEPFGIRKDGPNLARMLRSGRDSIRAELAARYQERYHRVPSTTAIANALLVLEGRALDRPRVPVALRLARSGDSIVLDMGDPSGRAIIIRPGIGWGVEHRSPVLFRRTELTGAYREPESAGSLDLLLRFINIDATLWPLLKGFLVAALIPGIPHTVLALQGEQGTGKSSAARYLVLIVDPSPAPLRSSPRDVEGWSVAAAGSWVVCLDNISRIPDFLIDAICRAVTGDALVRRALYTDSSLSVLAYRRVVMLTSIDPGAMRGDLADRLVLMELETIPPKRRQLENDLNAEFERLRPAILGGLLDLTARILAVLPSVKLDEYPRMADFAKVLAALDAVEGTSALETYRELAKRVVGDVVDSDLVAAALQKLIQDTGGWSGSPTELLREIEPLEDGWRPPHGWPVTPQAMAAAVRRLAPTLRALGYTVDMPPRRHHKEKTIIRLGKTETYVNGGVASSPREDAPPLAPPTAPPGNSPKVVDLGQGGAGGASFPHSSPLDSGGALKAYQDHRARCPECAGGNGRKCHEGERLDRAYQAAWRSRFGSREEQTGNEAPQAPPAPRDGSDAGGR